MWIHAREVKISQDTIDKMIKNQKVGFWIKKLTFSFKS